MRRPLTPVSKGSKYCLLAVVTIAVFAKVLATLYDTVVASVWAYCLICWVGNVRGIAMDRINRMIKPAGRILGESRPLVDTAYGDLLAGKLNMLLNDANHPLHDALASQLIPRSGRMRVPYSVTNRYPSSFIPRAITHHNLNFKR